MVSVVKCVGMQIASAQDNYFMHLTTTERRMDSNLCREAKMATTDPFADEEAEPEVEVGDEASEVEEEAEVAVEVVEDEDIEVAVVVAILRFPAHISIDTDYSHISLSRLRVE